jgi:hypothetical protein
MRMRRNPFTGETEPDPPPQTLLCPAEGRPDRDTVSEKLGVLAPKELVRLAQWMYDRSGGDPYECSGLFCRFTGIGASDAAARYDSTPPEMFPFGVPGVDGLHYGFLVHAPELEADDYPVGYICPMGSDGVLVEGVGTCDGIASIIRLWGDKAHDSMRRELSAGYLQPTKAADKAIAVDEVIHIPAGWEFLPSSDGVGVLAPANLFAPEVPVVLDQYGPVEPFLAAAREAISASHLGTALFYLREGYWFNWTAHPIELCECLCDVYTELGRPSLATVIQARCDDWRALPEEHA